MQKKNIEIVTYLPEHRIRFREINEEWINRNFKLEEEDINTLNDPDQHILKNGGKIFIALADGYPVGTCAYLNFGDGRFEMIKMAVDEKFRGSGIGKKLLHCSLEKMRSAGAKEIFLFSNTGGSAIAIGMYRRAGFKEVPLGETEFERADIRMELNF